MFKAILAYEFHRLVNDGHYVDRPGEPASLMNIFEKKYSIDESQNQIQGNNC